jgi:putative endonuclease
MNYCYLLQTIDEPYRTYIGVSKDPNKRLLQHNRVLSGGAKSTRGRQWKIIRTVSFSDKKSALRFEWYWKHKQSKTGKWYRIKAGLDNKLARLDELEYNTIP